MKKLLAMLLTLTLCMFSFAAFAEDAATTDENPDEATEEATDEIASVEVAPSYTDGQEVAIGETGLTLTIPSDWVAMDVPEGALAVYQDADSTVAMTLSIAAMDLDAVYEQCTAAGDTIKELQEVYVNNNYFMLADMADEITSIAYADIDGANTLCIAFQLSSADVKTSVPTEIIGTLAGYAEEAAE